MVSVHIHPSLRRFAGDQASIQLDTKNIAMLLPSLCSEYPKLKGCMLDRTGKLNPYINIYINGKNINQLDINQNLHGHDKIEVITDLVGG